MCVFVLVMCCRESLLFLLSNSFNLLCVLLHVRAAYSLSFSSCPFLRFSFSLRWCDIIWDELIIRYVEMKAISSHHKIFAHSNHVVNDKKDELLSYSLFYFPLFFALLDCCFGFNDMVMTLFFKSFRFRCFFTWRQITLKYFGHCLIWLSPSIFHLNNYSKLLPLLS